jgi:hypothetical protein
MSYDYRVTFVTDYLTITTNVCLELDETTGNLSDEAYGQATINGMNNIEDEIGKIDETIINDITVTLLLDDEEIFQSFKSVQYEYTTDTKGRSHLKIFGNYTHIVEGMTRLAWCVKYKPLNIWIKSF